MRVRRKEDGWLGFERSYRFDYSEDGQNRHIGRVVLLGDKLVVENVNMVKRHTRPNPQKGTQGGIVEKEAALHISNVQLWNPVAKKGDRVGIRTLADGRRVRFFKSNDEVVDA